jgi:pyruvate carboxylase
MAVRVYRHQIPGGQLSNLRQQAGALGLGDRFEEVELAYERANALLGDIIKVTPTSKVVGDLALFVVSAGIDWDELAAQPERFDLPASVIGLLRGDLGEPGGGFPQPFTDRALRGVARDRQNGSALDPEMRRRLAEAGRDRRTALAELQFPGPTEERRHAYERYGDGTPVPTRPFLYGLPDDGEVSIDLGPGVRLIFALEAIGEPDDRGMRSVLVRVNGQLRPIDVRDESVEAPTSKVERADPANDSHVAAPLTGVVTLRVGDGDEIAEGQPIAILEAMKMESTVTSPAAGTVQRVPVPSGTRLEQGDLIAVIEKSESG